MAELEPGSVPLPPGHEARGLMDDVPRVLITTSTGTTMTATTTADAQRIDLADASTVMRGRVRWFSHKGFGFIHGADGADIYVHYSGIAGAGFRTLPPGAEVRFSIRHTRRGPEAVDVVEIGDDR